MSNAATKDDVQGLEDRIDRRFDDLFAVLSRFSDSVDKRFSGVESKQGEHDDVLKSINKKYSHLERWIEEIARKTSIPLPR